jgi:hypothetical protein
MAQGARQYQESLHDEKIINIYSDNLSDVPDDTFSESDTASGSDKKGVNVLSEYETASEDSDSDDTTWVKVDKMPTLRFTGNLKVKQIPSHPTEVSETADLFLEIVSLTCYVRKQIDTFSKTTRSMTAIIRC